MFPYTPKRFYICKTTYPYISESRGSDGLSVRLFNAVAAKVLGVAAERVDAGRYFQRDGRDSSDREQDLQRR